MAGIKVLILLELAIIVVSAVGLEIKTVHPKDINSYDFTVRQRPPIMGRIVNGQVAAINQFPHQVSLKGFRGSSGS